MGSLSGEDVLKEFSDVHLLTARISKGSFPNIRGTPLRPSLVFARDDRSSRHNRGRTH